MTLRTGYKYEVVIGKVEIIELRSLSQISYY